MSIGSAVLKQAVRPFGGIAPRQRPRPKTEPPVPEFVSDAASGTGAKERNFGWRRRLGFTIGTFGRRPWLPDLGPMLIKSGSAAGCDQNPPQWRLYRDRSMDQIAARMRKPSTGPHAWSRLTPGSILNRRSANMAGGEMPRANGPQNRFRFAATRLGKRAPGSITAAGWRVERAWHFANN